MCGHFPNGVETFERRSIVGETKGEWYLRQMLGSANISGSKAMHLMTGNLSYQIEHHLFPDLPSNRYEEIAPKVQARVRAATASPTSPARSPSRSHRAWAKIVRLSFPNDFFQKTPVVAPVVQLFSRVVRDPLPGGLTRGLRGGSSARSAVLHGGRQVVHVGVPGRQRAQLEAALEGRQDRRRVVRRVVDARAAEAVSRPAARGCGCRGPRRRGRPRSPSPAAGRGPTGRRTRRR